MESNESAIALRVAGERDAEACVAVWVAACAARDGRHIEGVDERARRKFTGVQAWITAVDGYERVIGFVLATKPASGTPTDPVDAPVIGLLAVDPTHQSLGLGGRLLDAAEHELIRQGHSRAVLHVLADNVAAVRIYSTHGWTPYGPTYDHALLHRPTQSYVRDLGR